jgi:hypothetical protein
MTRSELLLGPDAVSATDRGLAILIRQPWYRSLPLSSVVDLEVAVDGVSVPREEIALTIEGNDYRLDELADSWQTVWFIQDAATVRVPADASASVRVSVALTLRFPYIIIDGVGPLTRRTVAERVFDLMEFVR